MARKRYNADRQMLGIVRLSRAMLLRGTALQGVAVLCAVIPAGSIHAQPAPNAHPTNPTTQLGSGSYSYNGTTTTINQNSQVLATGWRSFDVGSQQSVQINQPNQKAISVNRVLARDPSQIAGHINANGVFVLVNPSGVVFAKGAQVNANSVIVSTADVANSNLAAGKLIFDKPGRPGAMVINKGNISVAQTGLAALVAPGVANAGTISAPMGHVALAGGEASVIDLYGDGLMSIDVTKQVTTVPTGPDGKPVTALVTNTGVIAAKGGRIELTAKAVDGIVTNLVDAGGKIAANTAANGQTGAVVINGIGGSLTIEGDVSAAGHSPGTKGGVIAVNASNGVNIAATARLNASGKAGGGTVAIGTSLARAIGGPSVKGQPTAKTVTIAAGARIRADATRKGNGGRVTVLSTGNTDMGGTITARGDAAGGDGGLVEVSGDKGFSLTGDIDVGAPVGTSGTILLDPGTLIIVNAGSGALDSNLNGISPHQILPTAGGTSDTVSSTKIDSLNGNIILQASTLLQIQNNTPLTLNTNANLTLASGRNISVGTGSDITASGSGKIVLLAGTTSTGGITLGSNLTTGVNGGVTMQASGSIALNAVSITTKVLDVTTTGVGAVTQSTGGLLSLGTLQSSGGIGGSISLGGTSNNIGRVTGLAVTGQMTLAGSVAAIGNVSAAGFTLASTGSVSVDGLLNGGTAGAVISTGTSGLSVSTTGTIIGNSVSLNAGGMTIGGSLGATTLVDLNAGTLGLSLPSGSTIHGAAATLSAGSISLGGQVSVTGALALIGSTGAISETPQAVLSAGTLTGSSASDLNLMAGTNSIAALGNFAATGSFSLVDASPLQVLGHASGSVVSLTAPMLTLGDGTATAGMLTTTGSLVSIQTGSLVSSSGFGTINAGPSGTIEFAPRHNGDPIALGAGGAGTLGVDPSAATLTFGTLHLGAVNGATVAGSISIGAGVSAYSIPATLDLETTGAVTQTAALIASTLIGTVGSGTLITPGNVVGTVGALDSTGTFSLANSGGLLISGPVNGHLGRVNFSDDTSISIAGTLSAGSMVLTAAAFQISGSVTGNNVSLFGTLGAITEGGTGALNVGTLAGSAHTTASLIGTNTIGTIASFTAADLVVNNGSSNLTVAGPVTFTNSATFTTTGSLSVPGTIQSAVAGTAISLGLTAGPSINIGGVISDGGIGTTALLVNGGTGLVDAPGRIIAGRLTGSAAVATLTAPTNAIGTLVSFAASKSLVVTDAADLVAIGTIGGGSVVAIQAPALQLGDGTTPAVLLSPDGAVGLRVDALTVGGVNEGTIAAGTGAIEIGGLSRSIIALGATSTGGTLGVNPAAFNLTASTLRLGSVNGTTVASAIKIDGSGDLHTQFGTLDLRTPGAVTQSSSLIVSTLIGTVGSGTLITPGNRVGTVGALDTTGTFSLANSGGLLISGPVNGHSGKVNFSDDTLISIGGSLSAASMVLTAAAFQISGRVAGTNVALFGTTGAITETGGGVLNVSTLTGSAGTTASLIGTNAIGTIASFTAADLVVNDGSSNLTVAGPVTFTNSATFTTAGSLSVPGSIEAAAPGSLISLGLTAGPSINIGGVISDGGIGTTRLVANSSSGVVTADGAIIAGRLTGSAAVATLTGPANAIGTLASFAASKSLAVIDSINLVAVGTIGGGSVVAIQAPALQFGDSITAAVLLAPNGVVGLRADAVTAVANEGTIATGTGTIEIAGIGKTVIALGVASSTGTLGLDLTALGISASTLRLGSFNNTVVSSAIEIFGSGDVHSQFGTLDLRATGGITQSSPLAVSTLIGNAGSVVLDSAANNVGTLGGFTAANGFTLTNGAALNVAGPVAGGSGNVVLDAGALGLSIASGGGVTGASIGLTAGTLTIDGSLGTPGTLAITAGSGGVSEPGTGVIGAGVLTGSASGGVSLLGSANAIVSINGFEAAPGFTLTNTGSLALNGLLDAHSGSLVINNGSLAALSIGGTVTAVAASLSAGAITEAGSAFLNVGTLTGLVVGTANLQGSNAVGTLGNFTADTLLLNAGSAGVTVAGVVTGGHTVAIAAGGLVSVTGSIKPATGSTLAISLSGDTLSVSGLVNDSGAGRTGLFATNAGSITETGGTLVVGTLVGSAFVAGLTATTNTIAALGSFTAGSMILNDARGIDVQGVVNVGTLVEISSLGSVGVSGTIAPLPGSVTTVELFGTGLSVTGLVSDGGNGSTSLFAGGGPITEPASGTIISGTLGVSAVAVSLLGSANAISQLVPVSPTATLVVNDTGSLLIGGTVTGASVVSVTAGTLAAPNPITGTNVTLAANAGSLSLTSTIDASGSVSLSGAAGIDASGGLIIGDGNVFANGGSGSVALTNTGNVIGSVAGSAGTTFAINDSTSLIAGNISAGSIVSIVASGSLLVAGSILPLGGNTAMTVGLTGSAIGITGKVSDGGAGNTYLIATTGDLTGNGTVIAGTLSASGTQFGLTGSNVIDALGTLSNFNSIVLNDIGPLRIVGPISANTLIAISASTLTVGNNVTVPTATLTATAGTLGLGGSVNVSGNLLLSGSAAIVGGSATLLGGSALTATSAGGAVDLSNPGNVVASVNGSASSDFLVHGGPVLTVGNITAGSTANVSAGAMAVNGTVAAPHATLVATAGSLAIATGGRIRPSIDALLSAPSGLLAVNGIVAPPSGSNVALALNGASMAITGLVSDGGQGSTSLNVSMNSGALTESGTLIAGTLTGGGSLVSLTGSANQVGTLGTFTGQTLAFNDAASLTVAGPVTIGGLVAISDTSSISVPGTIAALSGSVISVGLSATALTVTGLISDSGSGSTGLFANGGTILDSSGTLIAGTLMGAASVANLTSPVNAIARLGNFAAGTSFNLIDSIPLTVVGSAGGAPVVAITGPSVTVGGAAGTPGTLFAASNGGLSIVAGTLAAGAGRRRALARQRADEVHEQLGQLLVVNRIVHGQAANPLLAARRVVAAARRGNFLGARRGVLRCGAAPLAAGAAGGTLSAASGTIQIAPTLATDTIALGTISSPGTLGFTPSSFAITANVLSLGARNGTVASGSITVAGFSPTVVNVPTLDIRTSGTFSQSMPLTAQTLIGTAAAVALTTPGNAISTIGPFSAPNGFGLVDAAALSVAGPLVSSGGTVVLDAGTFGLGIGGSISALAAFLTGGSIIVSGNIGVPGVASFVANQGTVSVSGTLTAGTLTGSALTNATFAGAENFGTLGNFTAGSGFTLTTGQALSVVGSVTAPGGTVAINIGTSGLTIPGTISGQAAALTAGSIDLSGRLKVSGLASLIASTGNVVQAGSAFLDAGTLTGSVVTTAAFLGTNGISALGGFSAPGGFSLTNAAPLTVVGSVVSTSGAVVINDGNFGLIVGAGGNVVAPSVTMSAGSIDIGGSVGSTGLAELIATQGSIGETGYLNAGTLTGSALTTAALTGTNLVGTLADFTAPGGFSLVDGQALAVSRNVSSSAGLVSLNTGTFGLTVPGTITGAAASLTAGSIDIGGSLGVAGLANFVANKGSLAVPGILSAGTLAGSVVTTATLNGSNLIATLGNFTAPNGLRLIDGEALTVAGSVAVPSGTIVIDDGAFALGVSGPITAGAATLSAGSLTMSGSLAVAGVADLIANQSSIFVYGGLTAGTLTGSAVTAAIFTGNNTIATLADFLASGGLTLFDAQALSVTGRVVASGGTVMLNTGSFGLGLSGTISGAAATLSAGSIDLGGSLGVTGAALLTANVGSIIETGDMTAETLSGSAVATASFPNVNHIGTIAAFTAGSALSLTDGQALTVLGPVSSGGAVTINDAGSSLNVPGTIGGSAVLLSAAAMDIGGQVGTGSVTLVSTGSINAHGVLIATSLQGSAGSFASLTGTNTVATLNSFTAPFGFTLANGRSLGVAGPVSASSGTVSINNGGFALDIPGTISGAAVSLIAGTIGLTGRLGAAGVASLTALSGGISEAPAAFLNAGTLTGNVATSAAFSGSNVVGTLGLFNAPSGFSLTDAGSLTVGGAVTAASGTIVLDTGTFGLSVPLAISGLAATLSAGSITMTGSLGVIGAADLIATKGNIGETGSLNAGTLTGSAITSASFTGTNLIGTLADFTAPTGFSLTDGQALSATGIVTAATGTIVLDTGMFGLGVSGALSGHAVNLTAGSIDISGPVGVSGTANLISNQGSIRVGGNLNAGTLTGSAITTASFTGTNLIDSLADFSASGGLTLNDGKALSVTGIVTAPGGSIALNTGTFGLTVSGAVSGLAATLSGGSIDIGGSLGVSGMANLTANQGGIREDGSLGVGTLTGSAITTASFTGSNRIGTLAAFSAPAGFSLNDGEGLTVAGLISSSGGTVGINTGIFGLSVGGGITALSATLSAGAIDLGGSVGVSGIADLTAVTGAITEGGTLIAGTLTGSVNTTAAFTGTNVIPTLADFVAPGGLTLFDTRALTVASSVASGGAVVLNTGNAALSVAGTITGSAATLMAGSVDIPGSVNVTGAALLSAGTGNVTETGAISAASLSGAAGLASLTGANRISTLSGFTASTLNLNDLVSLNVAGPVSIGNRINISDSDALVVSGAITPTAGSNIIVALTGSALTIPGIVSDGGGGSTSLVTTNGAIDETGALIAGTLTGSAAGGGPGFADVRLANAQIATLGNFSATGNMLIRDDVNLVVAGSVFGGTHGGAGGAGATSVEIDVLGAGGNLTLAQSSVIHAGLDGALTGNVTLRAGSDSAAGGVEIDGGVYAAHGGAVMVTAGYNVGSNAWNVVGSGSNITLTGTIWGDQAGGSPAGLVNLGAAGAIDEPVAAAAIGAALLTGRAGGHVNLAETANGALAPVASANRIAMLGGFVSNARSDDPLGFLLRDGQALTVSGPVVDYGASASRGIAISVVPGAGGAYTAADLIIAGLLQAATTVNPQATGSIVETPSGQIIARTLTTQSGVIPSTETSGNTPGSYPTAIVAANASAFYGNAGTRNANQVGTLANATVTGKLSLFDSFNLAVAGNIVTGVSPSAAIMDGSIAVGTGMTLATPGVLSVSGMLDVAYQGGVLSLSGDRVVLGDAAGPATLKAATIQIFGLSSVSVNNNTVLYTGGDVFRRPTPGTAPVDPGPATPGAHILVGAQGVTQTGMFSVQPYTATTGFGSVPTQHPELDIRLTAGGGLVTFDPQQGLSAPATSLLLSLGATGVTQGKIVADSVAVFYTNTSGQPTSLTATLNTATGTQVSGQAAASQSFISKNGVFIPSNHFQVNACAISSINCIVIPPFATLPIINPLRDLPTDFLSEETDDPDLLIPNVSDRED